LKKLFMVQLRGPIPCDAAVIHAGFWRRSRARSAAATTTAAAPSVSRQQSSRRSGSEMKRERWWSSTVIGSRIIAIGLLLACRRMAAAIQPRWREV